MTHTAHLTAQEIQAAHLSSVDFAAGYPQLDVSALTTPIYLSEDVHQAASEFPPTWTPTAQLAVDDDLESSVAAFLRLLPGSYCSIRPTFSGGVALDRALAAAARLAGNGKPAAHHVITTSPSIDIMRQFLEERGDALRIHFVESRKPNFGALAADAITSLVRGIRSGSPNAGLTVLLTSPENPTGEFWSRSDLCAIGCSCRDQQATLVVDHAFLTAGVHRREDVPAAWEVLPPGCDWIALWDTSKTFGLNEDKLGFLICGSEQTASAIQYSLDTIQFGVSRRQKLFFARLLSEAVDSNYLDLLRATCRANLAFAASLGVELPFRLLPVRAGSLALLELAGFDPSADAARSRLLSFGIGVISAGVFFHTDWRPTNLLRIALARDTEHFARGFALLAEHLTPAP